MTAANPTHTLGFTGTAPGMSCFFSPWHDPGKRSVDPWYGEVSAIMSGNLVPINAVIDGLIKELKRCRTLNDIRAACGVAGEKEEITRLLIRVLGVDELSVRWKAAVALTDIGTPAVDDLILCLMDEKVCVRSSAAWVLGTIGDKRALSPLRRSMEDTSPDVRQEALEALRKLQGEGATMDEQPIDPRNGRSPGSLGGPLPL